MKIKAERKNSLIELETDSVKLINLFYYFLKIFGFEVKYIKYCDGSDEDVD